VPFDETPFARAVVSLLCDAEARERMGLSGRAYSTTNYSYDRLALNLEHTYAAVVERRSAQAS